jgi:hypothetical protein
MSALLRTFHEFVQLEHTSVVGRQATANTKGRQATANTKAGVAVERGAALVELDLSWIG